MPDVVFNLDASEGKLVTALLNITRKQDDVAQGFKKSKKAGDDFLDSQAKGMGEVGKGLEGMVKNFVSIEAAIGLGQKAFAIWKKDLEDAARLAKEFTTALMSGVAAAGDQAQAGRIQAQLLNADMPGMGLQGRTNLYAATRDAMPQSSIDRVMDIVTQAGKARGAGFSEDQVAQLGARAGDLSKVYEAEGRGNMSAKDLVNAAQYMTEQFGRRGQKFDKGGVNALSNFVSGGLGSTEEGIGLMLSTLDAGGSVDSINQIVQRVKGTTIKEQSAKDPAVTKQIAEKEAKLAELEKRQQARREQDLADDEALDAAEKLSRPKAEKVRKEVHERQNQRHLEDKRDNIAESKLHDEIDDLKKSEKKVIPLTDLQKKWNAGDAHARFQMLMQNPDMLDQLGDDGGFRGEDIARFKTIAQRGPAQLTEGVKAAMKDDLMAKRSFEAQQDPNVRAMIQENEDVADAELSEAQEGRNGPGARLRRIKAAYQAKAKRAGLSAVEIAAQEQAFDAAVAIGQDPLRTLDVGRSDGVNRRIATQIRQEFDRTARARTGYTGEASPDGTLRVVVTNSDELKTPKRGFAGKDAEGVRNGGNE